MILPFCLAVLRPQISRPSPNRKIKICYYKQLSSWESRSKWKTNLLRNLTLMLLTLGRETFLVLLRAGSRRLLRVWVIWANSKGNKMKVKTNHKKYNFLSKIGHILIKSNPLGQALQEVFLNNKKTTFKKNQKIRKFRDNPQPNVKA